MQNRRRAFLYSFTSAVLIMGSPLLLLVGHLTGLLEPAMWGPGMGGVVLAWAGAGWLLGHGARRSLGGFLSGAVPGAVWGGGVLVAAPAIAWATMHGQEGAAMAAGLVGIAAALWGAGLAVGWWAVVRAGAPGPSVPTGR